MTISYEIIRLALVGKLDESTNYQWGASITEDKAREQVVFGAYPLAVNKSFCARTMLPIGEVLGNADTESVIARVASDLIDQHSKWHRAIWKCGDGAKGIER
jgi:hypothetical protein